MAGTASDVTLTVISYGATTEKTSQLEWFKQQLEGNLGVKVQIDTYPIPARSWLPAMPSSTISTCRAGTATTTTP